MALVHWLTTGFSFLSFETLGRKSHINCRFSFLQNTEPAIVRNSRPQFCHGAFYLNSNIIFMVRGVSLAIKPQRCYTVLFARVTKHPILLRVLWWRSGAIGEVILAKKQKGR